MTTEVYLLVAGVTSTLLLLVIYLALNCLHRRSHRHHHLFQSSAEKQPLMESNNDENYASMNAEGRSLSGTCTTDMFQDSTASGIKATQSDASSFKATTTNLTLRDVLDKTYDARHKWEDIGIQLGLEDDLEAIRQNNHNKADNCYREMLTIWLRKGGATWEALAAALNHRTVGYCTLANSIIPSYQAECSDGHTTLTRESSTQSEVGFKCRYCGKCTLEQYMKRECPKLNMTPDSLSFPYLDTTHLTRGEADTLRRKLQDETKHIIREFSDLVILTQESINKQKINPMTVANAALLISQQKSSMSLSCQDTKSIEHLVSYLVKNNHMSFFNYHIVEYIITKFGEDADKQALHEYETKFKNFCRRSVFEIPQDVLGPVPMNEEKLGFKVTQRFIQELSGDSNTTTHLSNVPTLSLQDIQMVRDKVAEVLSLENSWRLNYLGASPGCVELNFSAPKDITDIMKTQLGQKQSKSLTVSLASLDKTGIQLLCGPPGMPNVLGRIDSSIHLQWTKPEYHGFYPIQHYLVHCTSTTKSITWKATEEKYSIKITDLPLKEAVTFKIQAVTEIGHGLQSKESILSNTRFGRQSEGRSSFSSGYSSMRPRAYTSATNTDTLTEDHFDELIIKLSSARSKWYELGDILGLNAQILNTIKRDCNNNINLCLRKMLMIWLDEGNASRKALCNALNNKSVGCDDASNLIATGLLGTRKVTSL